MSYALNVNKWQVDKIKKFYKLQKTPWQMKNRPIIAMNTIFLLVYLPIKGDIHLKTLQKPIFRDLPQGECAGAPILKKLWDRFDFSLLLTQAGNYKVSGVPTWMLSFLYIIGLIAQCSSVSMMAKLAGKDALLNVMFSHDKNYTVHLEPFFND